MSKFKLDDERIIQTSSEEIDSDRDKHDLAQTLSQIKAGDRLMKLYQLSTKSNVFTQPDDPPDTNPRNY